MGYNLLLLGPNLLVHLDLLVSQEQAVLELGLDLESEFLFFGQSNQQDMVYAMLLVGYDLVFKLDAIL